MASLAWQAAWLLWDGRSWSEATAQARARAKAKQWGSFAGSKGSPGHDIAALYLDDGETAAFVADAIALNSPGSPGMATYKRFDAALSNTWNRLQDDGHITPEEIAAAKAKAQSEKAEIPLVLLIIGLLVAAGLAAYLVYQGATFVSRTLAVYEADRELVRLHEAAKEVETSHARREKAAGNAIPWDPYELSILKQLEDATERQTQTPTTEGPGGLGAGTGLLIGLAVAAAAVYLWKRRSR
jgi:hypothetical protein